jgi:hypothetical protein
MSDIKVGDYVKVEFTDSPEAGTYTIEGKVHTRGEATALWLGPRCIKITGDWVPGRTILEHKPKRMDEPGYGEHVSAAADGSVTGLREEYVRLPHPVQDSGIGEWVCIKHGLRSRWDELIDPQPVSPI